MADNNRAGQRGQAVLECRAAGVGATSALMRTQTKSDLRGDRRVGADGLKRRAPGAYVCREVVLVDHCPGHLALFECEGISLVLRHDGVKCGIAVHLVRSGCTGSRKVSALSGGQDYRAWRAYELAHGSSHRPTGRTPYSARLRRGLVWDY